MAEISIIFSISAILFLSPFLSRYLRIPTPSLEIILGTLASYYGLINDFYLFELIAHIGFFYLMFMAGTEVDLKMFIKIDKDLLKKGVLYLVFLYIISTISVIYLGMSKILIIIVPTLSVGLILALYKDYGKNKDWLNLSMIVGSMGELVSISLLTFAGAALEFGIGLELYKAVAYLIILLGGIVIIFKLLHVLFWWYPEIKTYLMPHLDKEEQDLRLSMGLFSLMIGLMIWLHLEIAFGAFIAGIFIATFFEHKEDLPHKISSFGFGFLVPIFFIYIGSTFNVLTLGIEGVIPTAIEIVVLMIVARAFSSLVFIKVLGKVDIFSFALSQSMPLTLMIAVATIAYESHSIGNLLYSSLILASLIEVIISMLGIKLIVFAKNYYKSKLNT
ncbi:cation:proton antiporter [Sulfurospirillum arcachonense]|uniref:cation:proton antiporter n=1 Tax=Sulfurospirillum arcachonense TaxID=57666 RepID=UPI0004AC7C5F|nr:cation:proton antiporter [Sulfurospirillum arcachonense]